MTRFTPTQEAAIKRLPTSIEGHYRIVWSPDDFDECGKGFYVDRWWSSSSPLFKTRAGAERWAARHGCTHEH